MPHAGMVVPGHTTWPINGCTFMINTLKGDRWVTVFEWTQRFSLPCTQQHPFNLYGFYFIVTAAGEASVWLAEKQSEDFISRQLGLIYFVKSVGIATSHLPQALCRYFKSIKGIYHPNSNRWLELCFSNSPPPPPAWRGTVDFSSQNPNRSGDEDPTTIVLEKINGRLTDGSPPLPSRLYWGVGGSVPRGVWQKIETLFVLFLSWLNVLLLMVML